MGNFRIRTTWAAGLILISGSLIGQIQLQFRTDIPVEVNGNSVANPWAGGLNSGQYGELDLNADGSPDLVIFDRTANRFSPFINLDGTYQYAPDYAYFFPPTVNGWVLFRDYNCDGRNDLFTDTLFGIKVFRNDSEGSDTLVWTLVEDPIFTEGFSGQVNLQLNITDIPAIDDIDGDGDLDILVYDFAVGGYIRYHRNLSMENFGNCDSLVYRRETQEWGNFMECSCDLFVFGEECPPIGGGRLAHAGGKSLLVLDLDGDGDVEVGIGQEACLDFKVLENQGDSAEALFTEVMTGFPDSQQPLSFPEFPAAFLVDINGDGLQDLVAAPNVFANTTTNNIDFTRSSWLYLNQGTEQVPEFVFSQDNFLQDQMIDLGEEAIPALLDLDGDADLDLLIGSRGQTHADGFYATLHYFENVGSRSNPVFRLANSDYLGLSAMKLTHLKPYFADLNGDARRDLVLASTSEGRFARMDYMLNGQSDPFDFNQAVRLDLEISPDDNFSFADLNQDQVVDILIGRVAGRLEFWRGRPGLQFSLETETFAGIDDDSRYRNLSALAADLDTDGNVDLLTADASGRVLLYEGSDFESATEQILISAMWTGTRAMRVGARTVLASGDLDGNGSPDLLLGDRQGGVQVIQNQGAGTNPNQPAEPALEIVVFPNPSNGLVNIRADQNARLEVFSVLGQKIIEEFSIKGNENHQLDVRNLPGGIYLLNARGQSSRAVKKLIVQ